MKRVLPLILALALMLSLTACGGDNASHNSELTIYEPVTADDFEFVVMGSSFFVRGPLALEPLEHNEKDDSTEEVFAVVYFGIGNAGQTECDVPGGVIESLDYNNGFIFECNASSIIDGANWTGSSNSVSATTGPSPTLTTLSPLSNPKYGAAIFMVPREVMENESAPLVANISLGEHTFTYSIRPLSEVPSVYESESELVQETQTQYDMAWLIRNIGYYSEIAYDNVGFAWKYAGNTNGAGELKFADEYIERLGSPYDAIYQQIPTERIADLLPETATAMQEIQKNIDILHELLITMGETNSSEYVTSIQDTAFEVMSQISTMLSAEEMVQFGRFTTIQGRLNSI